MTHAPKYQASHLSDENGSLWTDSEPDTGDVEKIYLDGVWKILLLATAVTHLKQWNTSYNIARFELR